MNREKKIIIFIDSGDTIIDESTEIRDENDIVLRADVIEGADILLKTLKENSYRIALVADGITQSFNNIYELLGLTYCFEEMVCSSDVGVDKPNAKMFETAIEKMGLTKDDCKNIIMVGNNVVRDIVGAKHMGIKSVLLDWSPRYRMEPNTESETPDYIIHKPIELLKLLEELEV